MFGWGAVVYVDYRRAPMDTLDIYVIGKQWMWKVQQPTGLREINELHVPVGRNVKLILASEDVIHDFSVPLSASRWTSFPATTIRCGSVHQGRALPLLLPAVLRHKSCAHGRLGNRHGANGICCVAVRFIRSHRQSSTRRRKALCREGFAIPVICRMHRPRAFPERRVWGQRSLGQWFHRDADDAYLRESILNPQAKIVAGYAPLMPSFQGQLTEEQIIDLTSYIKSLQSQPCPPRVLELRRHGEEIVMSTTPAAVNQMPREHYLNATYGIRSWLLTTDHKRIALLYLASVTFFFFVGGAFATMIRIHLLSPRACWSRRKPTTSCSPCTAWP